MAQAQTRPRAPRGSLTRAQRRKIRDWRSDLGHAIWNLNESPLVHELRRMHELQKPWEPDQIMEFSGGIEAVVLIALEIRHELAAFLKKGGVLRKGGKPMGKQYRDRLEGALEGIWLGVGYLRNLMPDTIAEFVDEHLGDVEEEEGEVDPRWAELKKHKKPQESLALWEHADMLFFSYCPVGVTTRRALPKGARIALLEEQVERMKVRERLIRELDLGKGFEKDTRDARLKLQRQLKSGQTSEVHTSGGCYNNGMKALRAAVTQMFYTLQAKDVRRIKLDDEDSDNWHSWSRDIGEPPASLVEQMQEIADEEGRVIHVFDKENNLVYVAMPLWFSGEDPDSMAQRAALKQSKKVRQQWGYDYRASLPADTTEFYQSLDSTQRRRVTEFLKRHPERSFSINEIAALADVPVHVPAEAERFQAAAAAQFAKNPNDVDGIVSATDETARNAGLMSAIWKMDFD